ncbi:TPA: hypothetical protein ACPZRZ_003536 [Yersinia enterocolitica]|uniref:hypothetical protein n=1 Tax=Yersinia intermedia TaxID=631 RepID=UPI0005E2EA43|nr:hypothetical protein [Yersinia intermedia]CNH96858.1 Uncharacterised protein [Yersinia intermedia]
MADEHLLTVSPTTEANWHNENVRTEGLLLRDYFAARALGLCYAQYLNYAAVEGFQEGWRTGVALDAYMMADAMIKARG